MPIGEVCHLVNGRAFKPSEWGQDGLPIIRIQNLNDRTKPFNRFNGTVSPKHLVQCGDVLLSWSGTPGTSFGCFVWDREPGVLNQHIFKVEVRRQLCEPEYFVHAVNSVLDEMIREAHGGVGLRHITKSRLQRICLPIAPLSEQRRIVARIQECLARVEEVQRLQHLALKELDAVLPAYLSELEQSLECPRVAVEELVFTTQNGRSIRPNGDSGNGRVLTLSAVRTPTLDLSASKTVELDCRTAQNYAICKGDVFVSRSNTSELVGLAAVANCDGPTNTIYPDLLIRLKPRIEKVAPSYLAQALRFPSSRRQIRAYAKGTSQSMVKISGAELREVTIPLPALADQERIVAKIEALQATCRGLSEALSMNSQALADAVLKKAFAGEL